MLLLCGSGSSGRWVYHALNGRFDQRVAVIREQPQSRLELVRRRCRRLGVVRTFGQVAFSALIPPLLRLHSRRRTEELKQSYGLDESPLGDCVEVTSVNSEACRQAMREIRPGLIVVVGTRIIGRQTLAAAECPIVNVHAGITPAYRGVHGAYWALVEGRRDLVGTTVHRVDAGIDTGEVLGQVVFEVSKSDSFVTYPLLHFGHGIPLLLKVVKELLSGRVPSQKPKGLPSRLRYHPTLWSYLYNGVRLGVW